MSDTITGVCQHCGTSIAGISASELASLRQLEQLEATRDRRWEAEHYAKNADLLKLNTALEQRVKELEAGYDAAGVKNVMEWRNRLQARAAQFPVMLDALRIVMEDFVESEGCYCGQIVGGTDEQGLPKGVCGTCKGCAAIQAAEAVERSK